MGTTIVNKIFVNKLAFPRTGVGEGVFWKRGLFKQLVGML